MATLNQLALTGAMTLLGYVQRSTVMPLNSDEATTAEALAATLCEMLTQLEQQCPGITQDYGWSAVGEPSHHGDAVL